MYKIKNKDTINKIKMETETKKGKQNTTKGSSVCTG